VYYLTRSQAKDQTSFGPQCFLLLLNFFSTVSIRRERSHKVSSQLI